MANPHGPGTTGASTTGVPPIPPLDPEEVREIQLLAEAVLVSFTATPESLKPFGRSTLAWEITMPSTAIPGVHPEVHLYGVGDQVVDPKGSQVVAPYGDTTYAVSLRTPLASRPMGTVNLAVDFGACTSFDPFYGAFASVIRGMANNAFPGGGQVTLRGTGASVDIGYNSFVIDIPLTASVPYFFDPDVDVSLGFSVSYQNNEIRVTHNLATTNVSFGTGTSVITAGCGEVLKAALEAQSNGFLSGFIGPVIASRLADALTDEIKKKLELLNKSVPPPPVPYRFYDITLTVDNLTYRFCPANTGPSAPPHHTPGGGGDPLHT